MTSILCTTTSKECKNLPNEMDRIMYHPNFQRKKKKVKKLTTLSTKLASLQKISIFSREKGNRGHTVAALVQPLSKEQAYTYSHKPMEKEKNVHKSINLCQVNLQEQIKQLCNQGNSTQTCSIENTLYINAKVSNPTKEKK